MTINIDNLKEPELIDLNNRIVARLKFLREMRAHASMLEFSIGERVSFEPDGHGVLFGIVTKYNRKSVTVIAENGQQWRVSPGLLYKVGSASTVSPAGGKVIDLGKN